MNKKSQLLNTKWKSSSSSLPPKVLKILSASNTLKTLSTNLAIAFLALVGVILPAPEKDARGSNSSKLSTTLFSGGGAVAAAGGGGEVVAAAGAGGEVVAVAGAGSGSVAGAEAAIVAGPGLALA